MMRLGAICSSSPFSQVSADESSFLSCLLPEQYNMQLENGNDEIRAVFFSEPISTWRCRKSLEKVSTKASGLVV
jgi:hypothetical protein